MAGTQRPSVFVSYSHRDGIWLEKLRPHLGSLARERGFDVNFWDDTKIRPGAAWESELLDALGSARVAILLISSHFLDSDYIGGRELPPLLEAAAAASTTVLPVILSPCRYVHHPLLGKLQSVNPPSQPLQGMSAVRREALFLRVTEYVDAALDGAEPASATPAAATAVVAPEPSAADAPAPAAPTSPEVVETAGAADTSDHEPLAPAAWAPVSPLPALAAQPRALPTLDLNDDWRRVVIQKLADGSLLFQSIVGDERLESRVAPPQQRLVDRLVTACTGSGRQDRLAAATLYELLVPADLKGRLFDGRGVLLTLDAATARIPWELLLDMGTAGGDPGVPEIGLRCSIVRKTVAERFTPHPGSSADRALIIGAPAVDPAVLPELPGAVAEARQAADQLTNAGFEVECRIGDDALQNFTAVLSRPCRVLHMTGHGAYEYVPHVGEPALTGFVMGVDAYFTATEVLQMRTAPEVVFLNAAFLGRHGTSVATDAADILSSPATSMPDQFLAIGTRAVLAPVGAIEDLAAEAFAVAFYAGLFRGGSLGEAVLEARHAAHRASPESSTWGLYHCYGDPEYRLLARPGAVPVKKTARARRR